MNIKADRPSPRAEDGSEDLFALTENCDFPPPSQVSALRVVETRLRYRSSPRDVPPRSSVRSFQKQWLGALLVVNTVADMVTRHKAQHLQEQITSPPKTVTMKLQCPSQLQRWCSRTAVPSQSTSL